MDFPDLGTTVEKKKDKLPPPSRKKGNAGGDTRNRSALQSMIDGNSATGSAAKAAAGDKERGHSPVVPVDALDIGPPPKRVPEPDEAAHKQATADIQARIDEGEKRVTEITEQIDKLKGKREEHKEEIQGYRGGLKSHRDKIRAAQQERELLTEEIKQAADELKKQEAKTSSISKELVSTDEAVVDGKIAEVQKQIEAGNLGFKAEKELVEQMKNLTVDKERLKDYQAKVEDLERKKQVHDDVTERRKAKTDEIAALREEDKVLADKLDALVGSAGGSQVSNPNDQIQSLLGERSRLIDSIKAERQSLKDATIFYKIKVAEHKEYLQAKQGYERKLERIAYHNRKAEQALRQAQWNENKGAREAERKQRDIRMAAVAAGCQVFVGGLSQRCTEDDLWEYFGNMGQVTDVMMPLDRDNGMHKGFAFVVLAEEAMALEVIEKCNGASEPAIAHKALSLKVAEKSRIQLEWEERNPPESRPVVEPRSRPVMGAAGDSRVARETNGAGEGGEAEDANTALPKRENKDKKVENEEPVIIVNVPTSDEPQPPGKWASIAKKNVAPPKGNAKVTAGAGGGAAVAAAEMPAAEEETAPPAVEETAPPAVEETAEEKIKRLEAQVEMLTKQRALEQAATAVAQRSDAPADAEVPPPKPKKGWGPIEKVPVMTNGFH